MHPLICPNLPQAEVGAVLLGTQAGPAVTERLERLFHIEVVTVPPLKGLLAATGSHADLQFFHLGGWDAVFYQSDDSVGAWTIRLKEMGFRLSPSSLSVTGDYPGDIALDAARVGRYLFCLPRHTDPLILARCRRDGVSILAVRQGYAKCSVCVADDHSLITADPGIAAVAVASGVDVCRIRPGYIYLDGIHTGFIGGCTGKLGPGCMGVVGRLADHPDAVRIVRFLAARNIRICELDNGPLRDVGGILPLAETDSN